jgi:CheY-like chemotaxis protein/HPt (histidine-containing phosphotransfer) domain-containing protein
LRDDAHRLKGAALVLGLDGLAVAAAALEAACDPRAADRPGAERAVACARRLLGGGDGAAERWIHDVRGELGIVLGHIDVLRLEGVDGLTPSQTESLGAIEAAATRIAAIDGPSGGRGEALRATKAAGQAPVVVVIEDDSAVLGLLERKLVLLGATVEGARDGTSGLRLARELHPDLVLLDLGLPDVDGRDVLRDLHAEGYQVAVSSGDAGHGLERELRALGAIAVVPKPVDDDALAGALARALTTRP